MESKKITFILDGMEVEAKEGATLLSVADHYNIHIPTLCHHKALEPAGLCRLCTVRVSKGSWSRFVTSCNYPVWEGMEVETASEEVIEHRKMIVELLLAKCVNNEFVRELATQFGIEAPMLETRDDDCILCGLCVRMCERIGTRAIVFSGRGTQMEVATPFDKFSETCVACGACDFICPTGHIKLSEITDKEIRPIPSEYDEGLRGRKPIYVPYAQAVPNIPAIDRTKCAHFLTGDCKICADFCPTGAIDHKQVDEEVEIEVGAIVLATGCQVFDPGNRDIYSYNKSPNVVTSLEFERILAATGPYSGHLVRPSDEKEPEKIAWIQCVGSRDVHPGTKPYCSAVCCTYAIKEAIVAKEHSKDSLDAAIFYIDIRTQGKDFERYYNRAKKAGVRFIKSKISNIVQVDDNGNQLIRYTDETGRRVEEEFDMVVLSVGLEPAPDVQELAERLGIELDDNNFSNTGSFTPVSTSKPGIYACGVLQGPKDIPYSVMQASAAASAASSELAAVRGTLVQEKTHPSEQDVSAQPPQIGVFVCNCGVNVGGIARVPEVVEYAKSLPNVIYAEENLFTCSQDAQKSMRETIAEKKLNRVVVAACSPRTHEPLFQETMKAAGLNKYLFEMANIRNQNSWVHQNDPDAATAKAKDLVRMAVAKATLLEALEEQHLDITPAALVVGGGLAGMRAALSIAESGYAVHLVEKADRLGGQANHVHWTWKGEDVQPFLINLDKEIRQHPLITVHLGAEVTYMSGFVGNFHSTLTSAGTSQEAITIDHGAVVVATGGVPYRPEEYLYGEDSRVFIAHELDDLVARQDPMISEGRSCIFIQCVGSRNDERPYCSQICCSNSLISAMKIKEINPDIDIYILYRDIRTYGLKEALYTEARAKGIMFIRYSLEDPPTVTVGEEGELEVEVIDQMFRRPLSIQADFINLATAMEPAANEDIARHLKVPLNQDGFFAEAHVKLRPVDFATDGIFVCGLAHYPKDVEESLAQAMAAAARAASLLAKRIWVSSALVAHIDAETCVGCQGCLNGCSYGAIDFLADKHICQVNIAICKGCGSCAAACPSGSARLAGFARQQLNAQIVASMRGI
ncbi:MAG: FAD-dependent oxidoreductase [Deltaproteobacteria bacterium]|nr:MAG: FAD-dependent oxidoreductase [Deltaproteobacteria bacterium]